MLDKRTLNIALVQMRCSIDQEVNLQQATAMVEEGVRKGAAVICLPELYRTQYFCQCEDPASFDLAESIPGSSTETFTKIAKDRKVTIIVPVFERRAAGVYHNSVVVIDERGEMAGLYRKMHIPDDPAYYEKFYFTPGDRGFQAIKTRYASGGPVNLLGSMVSGGGEINGASGGGDFVLSHSHWLASQ